MNGCLSQHAHKVDVGGSRLGASGLLEEQSVRDAEQSFLFPVFLVLRHLGFQRGPQVFAHGAVQGGEVHSKEVPEGRKGHSRRTNG